MKHHSLRPIQMLIVAVSSLLTLTACDNTPTNTATSAVSSSTTRVVGVVLNDEGPVTSAKIEAVDSKGQVIARSELKNEPRYAITLPSGTAFPVILTASPEGAGEPLLKAAIPDANVSEQDVSAVTTIIVDTALSLGGLTEANLTKAAGAAIALRRKSGGGGGGGASTTQSFKGDPTKQYGGWH